MSDRSTRQPEPEIIPPGAPLPRDRGIWANADTHSTHYVYATRIGPIGLALMMLAGGVIGALALLLLVGAAFVGFAAVGVLAVAALIAGILRRPR